MELWQQIAIIVYVIGFLVYAIRGLSRMPWNQSILAGILWPVLFTLAIILIPVWIIYIWHKTTKENHPKKTQEIN
jgi:hypothetical protein